MKKLLIPLLLLITAGVSSTAFSQALYVNPPIDMPEYNQLYQAPNLTVQQKNMLDNIQRNYANQLYQSNNNIINYTRQYQQLSNSAKQDPQFAKAATQVKSLLNFEVGRKKILYENMMKEGRRVVENNGMRQ